MKQIAHYFGLKLHLKDLAICQDKLKSVLKSGYQTPGGLRQKAQPFEANRSVSAISELVSKCNWVVDEEKPWALAKDSSQANRLDSVLYNLAESLRIIAILISPMLPRAAHGIFDQLNWKMELSGKEERFSLADAEWGRLPDGHVVGKPVPLFPRDRDS